MNTNKIQKQITKVVIAVALTLALTGTSGMWDNMLGLDLTPSASACVGSGSTGGGGC